MYDKTCSINSFATIDNTDILPSFCWLSGNFWQTKWKSEVVEKPTVKYLFA